MDVLAIFTWITVKPTNLRLKTDIFAQVPNSPTPIDAMSSFTNLNIMFPFTMFLYMILPAPTYLNKYDKNSNDTVKIKENYSFLRKIYKTQDNLRKKYRKIKKINVWKYDSKSCLIDEKVHN